MASSDSSDDGRRALALSTLLWRLPLAAVAPHRVFREISSHDRVSWATIILIIFVATGPLISLHVYLAFQTSIVRFFPTDWLPFIVGWAFYTTNTWLLCVLMLVVLHRLFRGPVRTVDPLKLASYYFIGGLGWIAWLVDVWHLLLHIRPVRFSISWLPWVDGPELGNWMRFSHVVMLPWAGLALWLTFRHVLRLSGPRQLAVGCIVAVISPVAGRLGLYPLANLIGPVLRHVLGRSLSGGWVILVTQILVTAAAAIALWGLLRGPSARRRSYVEEPDDPQVGGSALGGMS